MELKVQRIGNSAGFRVPKVFMKEMEVDVGSTVDALIVDGQLIIRPKRVLTLDQMLATCTPENTQPTEDDLEWLNDRPMGNELL